MKISDQGLSLIKAFESCLKRTADGRFRAYVDPVGVLTIGWGHTNHHGRKFTASSVWTQEECDAELAADMAIFEQVVENLVRVPLQQYQADALVSFSFNCGEGALTGSTLLKRVNAGDFDTAAREFHKWNRGKVKGVSTVLAGLVRRRASESLLFQGLVDANYDGVPDGPRIDALPPAPAPHVDEPAQTMPQQVDPPDEAPDLKPPVKSSTIWGGILQFKALIAGSAAALWDKLVTPEGIAIFALTLGFGSLFLWMVIKGRLDVAKIYNQAKGAFS